MDVGTEAVKDAIARRLEQLPQEQQWRVLGFMEGLSASELEPTPGAVFLRFAGTMSAEDVDAMERAIEEDCEGVDTDEW